MKEDEPGNEYDPYPSEVDPSKLLSVLRSFELFDELYLHMQAMNIAIVDSQLLEWEHALLREYVEIERTPVDSAMFVSAISQMWIFSVYELLRTWRQRINELIAISTGKKNAPEPKGAGDDINFNRVLREASIKKAQETEGYSDLLQNHLSSLEPAFRMCEGIRMTLAKHEVAKSPTMIPRAPGYARINMLCGAMDFEVIHKDESFEIINRRDIAECIRSIDTSALIRV